MPIYEAKGSNDATKDHPIMSPNVGNFVHDLVEMAKAMETLPQVQAELSSVNNHLIDALDTVAKREASILDLKTQIEALNEKVRQSEVAKDAAETMFLEADDRTSRALAFVKATFGNAGALIQALEPPRPQPTPEPVPVQAMPEVAEVVQSQTDPMPAATAEPLSPSAPTQSASLQADAGGMQDQSESPLPPEAATPTASASLPDASYSAAPNIETTTAQPDPKLPPYAGLRYYDHLTYVSLSDWLAGGGTDEDYNWRPELRRSPIY